MNSPPPLLKDGIERAARLESKSFYFSFPAGQTESSSDRLLFLMLRFFISAEPLRGGRDAEYAERKIDGANAGPCPEEEREPFDRPISLPCILFLDTTDKQLSIYGLEWQSL